MKASTAHSRFLPHFVTASEWMSRSSSQGSIRPGLSAVHTLAAGGLGGGVGRMREVCGAVSGAAMVIGSITCATDGDDKQSKAKNYELVREFAERFKQRHGDTVICREMLKLNIPMENSAMPENRTAEYYKNRPCLKAVEDAADILSQIIEEYEKERI